MTDNDCVFCDRAQIEQNLIAETDEYYVVASLGQITDGGYVLLIPKKHISCFGNLSVSEMDSLRSVAAKTRYAIGAEYHRENETFAPVTTFEHGIVGQTINHAHLHLIPARLDIKSQVSKDFPNSDIVRIEFSLDLQRRFRERDGQPYLFWEVGGVSGVGREAFICWNPPAPAQYLRTVTAALLGRPERGDWRGMDPELDERLRFETVSRLMAYSYTFE